MLPRISYALSPHTFVCVDGRQAVVLDLKEDRHLQISLEDSIAWRPTGRAGGLGGGCERYR